MGIEFMRIAADCYVVYKDGVRITPIPLTKKELHKKILELDSFAEDGGEDGGKAENETKTD